MKRYFISTLVILFFFGNICGAKIISPKSFRKNGGNQKPVPLYPILNGINVSKSKEDLGLTIGIKAGSTAGLAGAMGDIMYSLSNMVPGAAIRGSFGYLTGSNLKEQDDVKIAAVNLDGVIGINFLNNEDVPFDIYIGGGLIYPWKVNKNRGTGAWGAHAYMGGKYLLEKNSSIYGELAYSGIKYSSSQNAIRGIEAMLGYGYSF